MIVRWIPMLTSIYTHPMGRKAIRRKVYGTIPTALTMGPVAAQTAAAAWWWGY